MFFSTVADDGLIIQSFLQPSIASKSHARAAPSISNAKSARTGPAVTSDTELNLLPSLTRENIKKQHKYYKL